MFEGCGGMPDRLDSACFAVPIFFHRPCGARAAMGERIFS